MDIREILDKAAQDGASDIFLIPGLPISERRYGRIEQVADDKLSPDVISGFVNIIYELAGNRDTSKLLRIGDDDFSFALPGVARFRVSAFKQRGTLAAVIRIISFVLPDYHDLGIPEKIMDMCNYSTGMVLVTGPAGSGKSTTLACMVDRINQTQERHIITLEDPIEYLHRHNRSIVSQREISIDTESYVSALRAALRQSPDVILLGEMRDYETISIAMTAAETGHLLFSTLHTIGAAKTIDRIIDVFPANQQRQVAVQLSLVLNAVVSQQLVPAIDGGVIPVYEIMTVTPAIRNMIRENKTPQIEGLVYSSSSHEVCSMDNSLTRLYKEGKITKESAINYATNPEMIAKKLEG